MHMRKQCAQLGSDEQARREIWRERLELELQLMPTGCEERRTAEAMVTAMCSRLDLMGGTDRARGTHRGDDARDQGLQC